MATRSEVSICNAAIALLAGTPITSLSDTESREAVLCNSLYSVARDEMLEAADWTFAVKRVQLASAGAAEFLWDYRVLLPGDHFRTLGVWTDDNFLRRAKYAQEDREILVMDVPIYLKYIFRVTDPVKFSPLFVKALYTDLASKLCVPLTEDMKRETTLSKQVEYYLDEAAAMNGMQGSQQRVTSDAFIRIR